MVGKVFPSPLWWILLAISALLTLCGFYRFVWFMSVGYGFAVMGIGAGLLIYTLINGSATTTVILMSILLMVYGFRLGYFLLARELKNTQYRKTLESTGSTKKMPVFVNLIMWAYSMWMYMSQSSPAIYRYANGTSGDIWGYVGVILMATGIIGETIADKQKSAAKAVNPKRFCDIGLYKIVRCPNYFSEIIFWTGLYISGFGTLVKGQWIMASIGYVLIVFVMIHGAYRLEKRHEKNYGHDPEYRKYAESTPILFPFIPIYHLSKIERE
jgi:steroid 5-alpha reductase family enzyme